MKQTPSASASMVQEAWDDIRYPQRWIPGDEFELPNILPELFKLTPADTPLLSIMRKRNELESAAQEEFVWADLDDWVEDQP